MRWTIGVLSIPSRSRELGTLVADLRMQMERLAGDGFDQVLGDGLARAAAQRYRMARGDIEVLIDTRAEPTIGEKRQWVLDTAAGQYINFVDDDDRVARDYVQTIHPLLDGVDYIGFMVELRVNGVLRPPCYHSLQYKGWSNDRNGYYRNVSHLNPMRTEIARQGTFAGNYGEDREWAAQVHPRGEHYIGRPMYFYDYRPALSAALARRKAEL